jgi:hypothetical protein
MPYKSDRWITPGVLITLAMVLGFVVSVTVAAVAYLEARGVDSTAIPELVSKLVIAASSLIGLAVQLVNRKTATKTERNTGLLPAEVAEQREELAEQREQLRQLTAATWQMYEALPAPPRHARPDTDETLLHYGAAPAPGRR